MSTSVNWSDTDHAEHGSDGSDGSDGPDGLVAAFSCAHGVAAQIKCTNKKGLLVDLDLSHCLIVPTIVPSHDPGGGHLAMLE